MNTKTSVLNFPNDKPIDESPLWAYCEKHEPPTFIDALSGLLKTSIEGLRTLGISEQQVNISRIIYNHYCWTKYQTYQIQKEK